MARKGGQNKSKSSDSVQLNSDSKKHETSKRNKTKSKTCEPSLASDSVPETLISQNPNSDNISTNPQEEEIRSPNSPHITLNPSENQENNKEAARISMQIKLYIICTIAELKAWPGKLKPHINKGHIYINEKFERVLPKAARIRMQIKRYILLAITELKGWSEKLKPHIIKGYNYINSKFEGLWPKMRVWIIKGGKLGFVLLMAWLDCSIRGLDSLLRIGTASLFVLVWCVFLSLSVMIGVKLMLLLTVIGGCIGGFLSVALALILVAICTIILLWFYGSFWITSLFLLFGGISLALRHQKIGLFVTTIYAMYCAKIYVGWFGLFLGINLSFISSDLVLHLIKKLEENRSNQAENTTFVQDQDETFQFGYQRSTDRGPGEASTSGELNSEEEIERLLNCVDHYSALGLPRFAVSDPTCLKKEYRKKAMLVHPDKNLGNEKAAEAFKKLQNAYEILLDSLKKKTYDDELRGEELLNYFRHFQASSSQKRGRNGIFGFQPGQSEGVDEELRRVICKKCGNSHIWTCTDRSKSRARWCQECKDFHQAKDGDGWVEQSFQPLLFGLVQKMELPCAYVCADSKIYDATEWFICQGMRCPTNTHKPSFHINTNLTKPSNSKASTSNHKFPNNNNNFEEEMSQMTEEELFEWLQNTVNAGHFVDPFGVQNDVPGGSKSGGKKKKKGKKQR
ncbi:hypothetical protein LUZ60_011256 [Juncus effusus]|nr:hypothetical protein LUZ60_011256 [Juncus effusus]